MDSCYLIDASSEQNAIQLVLYDTSANELQTVRDEAYQPYLFVNYPLSTEDETAARSLDATIEATEKRDLFTGETRNLARVELANPSLFSLASRRFREKWEERVPYVLSYMYDHDLVFGAPYAIRDKELEPVHELSETLRTRFKEEFSSTLQTDPEKYELLERWFTLCFQPIPEIPLEELRLGEEIGYEKLYLAFLLSRIANLPLPTSLTNRQVSTWIRSILHSHLRRKNILIPRSAELRRGENVRGVPGALTFQPKTGTYFDTVVVDFESLYPSLIDTYNLSYETVDCGHEECAENRVPDADHYVCKRKRGIYSVLIGALRDLRIHWFKPLSKDSSIPHDERRLAEAASSLLKLILVSCYGVTVRIHGLAQPALAESITAYGRYALRQSWDLAENHGLKPLYGDTDSLFLDNPTADQVEWLIQTVKNKLRLDLAVDNVYSVCVLPRAMKAYFGIRKDGTPDVKGLTAIKSNSPPFLQNVFMDCVKELRGVKNWTELEEAKDIIRRIVKRAIGDLKSGRIPLKDLEYTVKLRFDPSERPADEALHQPYQCAVQLMDTGKKIGKRESVSFVKVKPFNYGGRTFTVKPAELVKDIHEINTEDYVRNLRTALNQTFRPMNISFDEEPKPTLADFI